MTVPLRAVLLLIGCLLLRACTQSPLPEVEEEGIAPQSAAPKNTLLAGGDASAKRARPRANDADKAHRVIAKHVKVEGDVPEYRENPAE